MRRSNHFALVILLGCSVHLYGAEIASAPHVRVEYEGIDARQAESIANVLSAAREVYAEAMALDMPDVVECSVQAGKAQAQLFTDGVDHISLRLVSKAQLGPPGEGNPFHLYGMCHELGHMAMYRILKDRDWLSSAGAEGWAHYAGSLVVDDVFKVKGEPLWWQPYDYRQDGLIRLKSQLKDPDPSDIARAAGQWQMLEAIIGPTGFAKLFAAWQQANIDPFEPNDSALRALAQAFPDKSELLEAWWAESATLLIEKRERSGIVKVEARPEELTGERIVLKQDDDASDGRRSTAGGGHARLFTAPDNGEWFIVAVHVFAQRYGPARAPAMQFEVALCDPDLKPIAQWDRAYALFSRDAPRWVKIPVTPIRVPTDFMICLTFNPTASNGVYMSFDSSTQGHSQTGTPGDKGNPFTQGDWMIRVELDRKVDVGLQMK